MTATGGIPQPGNSPSPELPRRVPAARWRRIFPGDERELGHLRRWLASLLPPCPARDDVTAVANELASNAIRHTRSGHGGEFAIEITWHTEAMRVAVADNGAPTGPHVIDDPASEHGRGLLVVAGLSAATGVTGDRHGRLVWADIPWGTCAAASLPGTCSAVTGGELAPARIPGRTDPDGHASLAAPYSQQLL